MMKESSATSPLASLRWKWVSLGVVAGGAVLALIVGVTASVFHNFFIPSLLGCTGFVVTGVIVGYFSQGITVKEAAIAGAILAGLVLFTLWIPIRQQMTSAQILIAPLFGFFLALAGGWVGEHLQQDRAAGVTGMQWRWVGIGVIVSVVLNSLGVFALAPLYNYSLNAVFVSFLVTFVIGGYIVGYFSHGVTIKEAALAGIITVLIDWLLVQFGLEITVPVSSMLVAMICGFLLSLMGAWVGERLQVSMQRQQNSPEV